MGCEMGKKQNSGGGVRITESPVYFVGLEERRVTLPLFLQGEGRGEVVPPRELQFGYYPASAIWSS